MAAPRTANIFVEIGGNNYTLSRENFSSVSIKRTAKDVCDSFTLNILDDDAFEIEQRLLSGKNDISFQYIDDVNKEYKSFDGFIISMNSSFIDNRNMLSLRGFVGISVKDKYETYSVPWNIVPKFDFSKVLDMANYFVKDENYEDDGGLDKVTQQLWNFLRGAWGGLRSLVTFNFSKLDNYEEIIDRIFDNNWISLDSSGNYYIPKYKDERDDSKEEESVIDNKTMTEDEESSNLVKNDGSYTIPIRPDKLIKFICCGGNFSELLESEYSDYKGTSFYDDDISEAEWYFIKKWFKKMGKFDGLGYTNFIFSGKTDVIEDTFSQSRMSYLDYIYTYVLPKCRISKGDDKYANFYLSFDGKTVKLDRLDASKEPTNIPEYMYYGQFEDSGENMGRITSFSPSLDILTAMIAAGSDIGSGADISNMNLITGKENTGVTVNASTSTEGRYNVTWGPVKVSSALSDSSNKDNNTTNIISLWNKAQSYPYQAEATITGFNKLKPQDYIRITILPSNSLGQKLVHHTSGTYFILEIEDEISGGVFSSKLKLIKNISKMGTTKAIQ